MITEPRYGSEVELGRGEEEEDVGEAVRKDGDENTFRDKRRSNGGFVCERSLGGWSCSFVPKKPGVVALIGPAVTLLLKNVCSAVSMELSAVVGRRVGDDGGEMEISGLAFG